MTYQNDIVASTIKLAQARTAQAQAEADLYRTKLGADAPGAADPAEPANWAAALFAGAHAGKLDLAKLGVATHDLRDDGPKPRPPSRPESTAHQHAVEQIRQTGQLFPQVPGATLTTNNKENN